MIVIVDYGMGNLRSVANAFLKIQADALISADREVICRAEKLVLPGVGAFPEGIRLLAERGLIPVLEQRVRDGNVPVLGICLGLQLMTRHSEEGEVAGLGWVDARTVALRCNETEPSIRVPHMGWNRLVIEARCPLMEGLDASSPFYFAHSYHLYAENPAIVMAQVTHGLAFPAIVQKGNVFGTQFHPEKSQDAGLRLLKNFATLKQW